MSKNIEIECPPCAGTGEFPVGLDCSVCNGGGKISIRENDPKCAECGGRGKVIPEVGDSPFCNACKGYGYISGKADGEI